jgi:para-nitrobenzyl esterase
LFDLSTALGAAHGLEIAFVFGNFGGGLGLDMYDEASIPARDELSRQMMSYWAEFAYAGKPGKGRDGDQVEWKPWQNGPDQERLMVLDTSRDRGIRMSDELITMESLKARFLADDSFADAEARCAGYRQLFFGAEPDAEEMASIGCGGDSSL